MKLLQKKIYTCLLLVAIFAFPLARATTEKSESKVPEEALTFLKEVIQFDVSKYKTTLVSNSFDYIGPPLMPTLIVQENLKYTLEFEDSKVNAIFAFKNGTFAWCNIYVIEGTPIYAESQPDNDIDKAKEVLDRYQKYNEAPGSQLMIDLLGTVDKVENTTKTLGNMKLEIIEDSESTRFKWFQVYNGIDTTILNIRFLNGNIRSFTNNLCLTTIGEAEVNISEEEAIKIAMEQVKGFSWKAGVAPDDIIEVKDFTILEAPVKTKLSMQPRDDLTLYPYWYIELFLDKVYSGGVSSIHVGLWADTGTVSYIQEMSYGEGFLPDETKTHDIVTPLNVVIVAVTIVAIIVIIIGIAIFKKRRK